MTRPRKPCCRPETVWSVMALSFLDWGSRDRPALRDASGSVARLRAAVQRHGEAQFVAVRVGDVEIAFVPGGIARVAVRPQPAGERVPMQSIDVRDIEDQPAPPRPVAIAALGGEV